jgi:UDP-N-acetylglucosamine--N-acetylmuramyl-(pentapeptide) pyrophosphoryl-undecaprenol N-acetylglucosamine transferase
MTTNNTTILIMAAGTGGHVFPALAIARKLSEQGVEIHWLATESGMENQLLAGAGYKLHRISVKGLRGKGLVKMVLAPFMIIAATLQSLSVIRQVKPSCVLGMGGYITGPGGLAAKLKGVPLMIHEQNAVAGLTNRLLGKLADKIFEAFPATFKNSDKVIFTGNPVRVEITALFVEVKERSPEQPLHLLVLGGSQGAAAINSAVPLLLNNWGENQRPYIWHQTGKADLENTHNKYATAGIALGDNCRVDAFIDDMATAYKWADVVICRSGASTVSELAVAGLPALFVPYPYHKDRQQTLNAEWLSNAGAAYIVQQAELSIEEITKIFHRFSDDREELSLMSARGKAIAVNDASDRIADYLLEVAADV